MRSKPPHQGVRLAIAPEIAEQHFELIGDRACCGYARCEPLGTIAATKACYRASTQGHDEECGLSGKTGIHYSQGVLTVTHEANKSDAAKIALCPRIAQTYRSCKPLDSQLAQWTVQISSPQCERSPLAPSASLPVRGPAYRRHKSCSRTSRPRLKLNCPLLKQSTSRVGVV